MTTTYFPDTDTLAIDIRPATGDVEGVYHDNEDVIFYMDQNQRLTGVFFDLASTYVDNPETCTLSCVIRIALDLSQQAFADMLDINVAMVRNWDQGRPMPDEAALRLLEVAALHPEVFRSRLAA